MQLPQGSLGGSLEVGAGAAGVGKDLLNTTGVGFIGFSGDASMKFAMNISTNRYANVPFLEIEVLYRHNVLYCRAQLFKHCSQIGDGIPFLDLNMIASIRGDLGHYSRFLLVGRLSNTKFVHKAIAKAVQDYHAFRAEGGGLFEDSRNLIALGREVADLKLLESLE